jgi:hypothetical protein
MSIITDHKYAQMISHRLLLFKRKSDRIYNFRCPFCGDSQRNKLKARGYLFEKSGGLIFKCHNCDVGASLGKVIDLVDPSLAKNYRMESYRDRVDANTNNTFLIPREEEVVFERPKIVLDEMLSRLDQLPSHHRAVEYVKSRQIPKERWEDLYYARDFKVLEALNPAYEGRLASDERLVIPFRREDGLLTGVTGRAMGNSSLRYATIRVTDDPLVYGLERIKRGKTIYVTEGPIDSMFLDNAIAAGGTDFSRALYNISGENVVLIFDNQPRNKQVVKRVEAFAQRGYAMVIWNSNWTYKDINDAVLSGSSVSEIEYLLNKSTFKGLALKLAIRDWKKC